MVRSRGCRDSSRINHVSIPAQRLLRILFDGAYFAPPFRLTDKRLGVLDGSGMPGQSRPMGFYADVILPRLCHFAMRNRQLVPYRERVIGAAQGRVLEIGMGSGLNLPFYQESVREIFGLEPSPQLISMAKRAAKSSVARAAFIEGSAESIPLDDKSVDTVVTTWTLCTIPHSEIALKEVRRVLKPRGSLLFVEHGLAPDTGVRKWQNFLTPAWKRVTGGCHLNRPIRSMIEAAGFRLERIETGYAPGPRPMTFFYEGCARPR